MADYEFRYQLSSAPTPTTDGSGVVLHDIWAVYREEGTSDDFAVVPARHKTICIPASQVQDAIADASPIVAYKNALVDNINTQPIPTPGWDSASLELFMDQNDAASVAASAADDFIVGVAGEYPVTFSL